jgi:hypothetical protein
MPSRRDEPWLVVISILVVVLGTSGAAMIVLFALWWNQPG